MKFIRANSMDGSLLKIVSAIMLFSLLAGCSTLVSGFNLKPVQHNQGNLSNSWLQFDGNSQHSGTTSQETILQLQNIAALRQLFQVYLPDKVYQEPVYLANVHTSRGILNLLFVTTASGSILAMDASNGNFIWERKYTNTNCTIDQGSKNCYTASVPAIDPSLQYVYSYGVDGKVHKLQVSDGTEVTTDGWPELVTKNVSTEVNTAALTISTTPEGKNYLYVALTGYPERKGNFLGSLTTINLADGSQKVFNASCSNVTEHLSANDAATCPNQKAGLGSAVFYSPDTNRVYFSTSDGTFDPAHFSWGNSVVALNPDGSGVDGKPVDSFTASNTVGQSAADPNQAGAAFAVLPASKILNTPVLGLQVGTDGMLRLLNLANLSGKNGPGNTGGEIGAPLPLPQGGSVNTQPVVWVNPSDQSIWVFISNTNGISALQLQASNPETPTLEKKWFFDASGTSPVLSGDLLFFSAPGIVLALNPNNGAVLWSDTSVGQINMNAPILVNGVLYVVDWDNHLTAYSLDGLIP